VNSNYTNRNKTEAARRLNIEQMKRILLNSIIILLFFPNVNFGQSPTMGTIENFVFFTSDGAITATAPYQITGDIGRAVATGVFTVPQNVNGLLSNVTPAAVTAQAATDLTALCADLNNTSTRPNTGTPAAQLGGVTYPPGVYDFAGATTMTGTMTLDAGGDPNALFIFRLVGACTPDGTAIVELADGALACNVFFIITGAIAAAGGADLKGNFIANPGAVTVGTGSSLEGRLLASGGGGAITFGTGTASAPLGCGEPTLTGPTAPSLGEADCYALFSSDAGVLGVANTGTTYINGDVGTNGGAGLVSGFNAALITGNIHSSPDASTATCATDVATALTDLDAITEDIELLFPAAFGNQQVLTPHTYLMNGNVTLTDTIFLNARGVESAVFVFKIVGGSFTAMSNSVVMLIDGALSTNVYWMVDDAVVINSGTKMKGTVIVDGDEITMNSSSELEGRLLTTLGAVTVDEISVSKTDNCFAPIAPYLGPAPDMGNMTDFVFFSSIGSITITDPSQVTGDIGADAGSITVTQNINGTEYNADPTTTQGVIDLGSLYTSLNTTASTSTHSLVIGNGEALNGQVYAITGAATLNGNLTLDGQGNANSIFIFNISSTLDIGANAQIILTNGALACNVFWVTEGDITFSTGTTMKGTFIANNADINYSSNADLEGRLLVTAGDIGFNTGTAYTPLGCTVAALTGPAAPDLASAICFGIFSSNGNVTNSGGTTSVNGDVGTNVGTATGFDSDLVSYILYTVPDATTGVCATDVNAAYTYLNGLTDDIELEFPTLFGDKQILTPHIYKVTGNTTLTDTLFFDAQGNSSGVFVIQIDGDFTANSSSVVTLINGALAENIYWRIDGAISTATVSKLKGTVIGNSTINMASGCFVEGRVFSTGGNITVNALTVSKAIPCVPPFSPSEGPVVDLGAAASFIIFTKAGVTTNSTANNALTGDVGSGAGAILPDPPPTLIGNYYDDTTPESAAAAIDLQAAYDLLINMTATVTTHGASYGNGDTLTTGVYENTGAWNITGDLYLDAEDDPNNFFIFRSNGALTSPAGSEIHLIRGAVSCNIYWATTAGAAISFAANTIMKGMFIAGGANTFAGADLEGGIYTVAGAAGITAGTAKITNCPYPPPQLPLPVELLSFTGECNSDNIEFNWSTASEINNDYFSIERSIDAITWRIVTTVDGAGNSTSIKNYYYIDERQYDDISYYRLKQTDFNGQFKYSAIIAVEKCGEDISELSIYPNPASETLNLFYGGDKSRIISISIYNLLGEMVYYSDFFQSKIVFENKLNGLNFLHFNLASKNIVKKFIVVD
jgi:hypothetical protein